MTTKNSTQINSFTPFLEPYTQLYSEGHLRLSRITTLYQEVKAKSTYKESYTNLKKVLEHCVAAKEEYFNSKTILGKIAKLYHDFLTGIGIETSLGKAYKALKEIDKPSAPNKPLVEVNVDGQDYAPKLLGSSEEDSSSSSPSSSESSGSGPAQSANEKEDNESKTDLQAQMMLAHYYALSKKEISVFPIGGTKDQPEKIMMANPNGNVYVLPLREKQGSNSVDIKPIKNEGTRLIYKGERLRLGKEKPEKIAIATTMHTKNKDRKTTAINNQSLLQEGNEFVVDDACFVTQVNDQEYAFAIIPKYLQKYFIKSHISEEKLPTGDAGAEKLDSKAYVPFDFTKFPKSDIFDDEYDTFPPEEDTQVEEINY